MIHRFGQYELDERLYELRRRGRVVKIEPKVFDMLAYLVRNRDRVVTRDELLASLWANEYVSDSALSYCVREVRKALGDDGGRQAAVETVRGRGFRFVAAATTEGSHPTGPAAHAAPESPQAESPTAARQLFVGREEAVQQLRAAFASSVAGGGRVVLITGEAGIGKTRTAEELAAFARERGAEVLGGRCHETAGAPAFWPWVQVLRSYAAEREAAEVLKRMGAGATDLAPLVPELAQHLAEPPQRVGMQTDQARFRFFDSLATFLIEASRQRPIVLLLDDLHQSDVPSLLAIQFVARALRSAHVLMVGTSRDTELGHPFAQTGGELARLDWSERIALAGLTVSEVAKFIERSSGLQPSAELVSSVHDKTAGNPFFLTEIVRLLMSEGRLEQLNAEPSGALPIPRTTSEAIARRLESLPPGCDVVLAAASVFGREFEVDALAQMSLVGSPRTEARRRRGALQALLDAAEVARVIEPVGRTIGRYRFGHLLVRDALYDGLPSGKRIRLHRVVGEALERMYGAELDSHLATLAHHFRQAAAGGTGAKAILYATRAAERAASMLAYEDASQHYREALELVERGTLQGGPARGGKRLHLVGEAGRSRRAKGGAKLSRDEARCDLLLGLGESQWKSGNALAAKETFARAADLARKHGLWAYFARAALGFGGGFRGFDVGAFEPALVDLLEEALRHAPRSQPPLRARLLGRLAVALCLVPDSLPRRRSLSEQSVRLAEAAGDTSAHLAVLYSRHWVLWGPDHLDERLATTAAMVRLAEVARDAEMQLHAHRFRVIDLMESGAVHEAEIEVEACERLAGELRQPYYHWYVHVFRGMRAYLRSHFDDAERLAAEALAIGQRAQSTNVMHTYGVQAFFLQRERGRMADLEEQARGNVARYPATAAWRCALGFIYSELNRYDDARREFEPLAAQNFADLPRDPFWLVSMSLASDTCAYLRDGTRAAVLYRLLEPYADLNVLAGLGAICVGSAARSLARLAATMGRVAEASRHFEDALTMSERLGSRHLVAHVQREYGELLAAQGDEEHAGRLLARALAIYESVGMTSFAERTRDLQNRTVRPRRKSPISVLR